VEIIYKNPGFSILKVDLNLNSQAFTKVRRKVDARYNRVYCLRNIEILPRSLVKMTNPSQGADKKIAAGICGILLGALGVHKFLLGYTTEGLIMLLVTILTCGFGGAVMGIIGLVEGIIYLTKSDEEFVSTYVLSKKGWF
jgi:TM2 domain-containing membrane protein YozV